MPATSWPHRLLAVAAATAVLAATSLLGGPPAPAAAHQQIQGSGSSWATNAINVWIAGVTPSGLQVVFTSTGSAQGRKDFGNATTDYGVTDIGYQGKDPQTGDIDLPCKLGSSSNCRDYSYLPIVAGGTAFAYHLQVAGQLIRNLRLSGLTLAKIFTGKITRWDDKAITDDNNGRKLPGLPIIPIVHAEGSGSSAQFTQYLDTQYPDVWRAYTGKPGETEYFPKGANMVAQTGSDGVMNYITSAAANGAIGYDEYSYALAKNYPVAKVQNAAGYYTLPTQFNVAVALQKAIINPDKSSPNYLLQDLHQVYTYRDQRTYPLSSYSYGVIPTAADDSRMNTAKRQTLADFLYYSVCQGQAQVGPVGYSALPLNLVQASFDQIGRLKTADPKVDLSKRGVTTCSNPTFTPGNLAHNHLADIAPEPPACDRTGSGPCGGAGDPGTQLVPVKSGGGGAPAGGSAPSTPGSPGSLGAAGGGSKTTAAVPGAGKPGTNPTSSAAAGARPGAAAVAGGAATGLKTVVNPDTGQLETVADSGSAAVAGQSTELAAYRQRNLTSVLAPLAALELLLALLAPPLVYYFVLLPRRRRRAA